MINFIRAAQSIVAKSNRDITSFMHAKKFYIMIVYRT